MQRSNSPYLLFIVVFFCLCCLLVCIEGEHLRNRRYQLFPLLFEKYSDAKTPDEEARVIAIKVYLNRKHFGDDVCAWYGVHYNENITKYEFEEGENFTNPELAGFPLDDNFSVRFYFAKEYHLHWFWRNQKWAYQEVDRIEIQNGFRWKTKMQLFDINFQRYGYRVKFRMSTLCDENWYSIRCDYFCNKNRPHVLSCDENVGTLCHSGYVATKDGNCVWTDVCKVNPDVCKNNGTCMSVPDTPASLQAYRCICPEDFGGQNCERRHECSGEEEEQIEYVVDYDVPRF